MSQSATAIAEIATKLRLAKSALPVLRLVAVASTLAAVSVSAQAPIDVRVALIIGNSAYATSPLVNPANDAQAMADVLKRLGFNVIELRDGTRAQMSAAISKASDSLKGKQGVGMLYYAGHGLQLDWRNYMVPVDANLKNAADVTQQTIDLSSVVDVFKVAGNRMNIVVLDACRDNPFGGNTSSGKGLAQLDAPPSTFLAYATAPGNVAEDGDEKSGNGLYTQYLLQELKRPTAKIEDVFKRVRLNVRKQSQGRQIPWESTSLEDDFFFNDGARYTIKPEDLERMAASALAKVNEKDRAAEAARLQEVQRLAALARPADTRLGKEQLRELAFKEEKAAWDFIKTSNNPEDFYTFLQRFPSGGDLSEAAQYRLDQLAKPKVIASLGKGQDASLGYMGPRFKVGDMFQFQVSDVLTNVPGEKLSFNVTSADGDLVQLNNGGLIYTVLGATLKNERGTFATPFGGLPAEFQVGKKWTGRTTQKANDGQTYELQQESKIKGREVVTVPAGTFQTYMVETVIYVQGGSTLNIRSWHDPRYGYAIKREEMGRFGSRIYRSERRELIALKADRS
ncbi:MAG: caspase family protein [Polaromonas sp.]|uniref:caspase family protein n=1 Tax=Polaromonas sp. TaxID=1869339 RepID=UPI0025F93A0F|nr:caspase family protein [Polaromonas sp.]MBI2725469.1 caspase family protein [Polaromonas sp.]